MTLRTEGSRDLLPGDTNATARAQPLFPADNGNRHRGVRARHPAVYRHSLGREPPLPLPQGAGSLEPDERRVVAVVPEYSADGEP